MVSHYLRLFSVFIVMVFAAPVADAYAKDPQPLSAQEKMVQAMGEEALKELVGKDKSDTVRRKKMRSLLNKYFDVKAIGRFAMGRSWRKANDKQKAEYIKLFGTMVVETYADRFKEYSGEEFEVRGVSEVGRDVMVHSKVLPKDGPALAIDWRIRDTGGQKYRVIDVVIEGISMGVTQRSEFDTIIRNGGGDVDVLLASLRK